LKTITLVLLIAHFILVRWYSPTRLFCAVYKRIHTCLKMFKTSKRLWHRVFEPYHQKTCRGPSSLCQIVPLAVSMQKGCTLN